MPAPGRAPTRAEAFVRRCHLNGVTDAADVARLLAEAEAKWKAADEKTKGNGRG